MGDRKDRLVARRARIERTIRQEPSLPGRILAERFGVSTGVIVNIARKMGVVLPQSEYPGAKQLRKLSNTNRQRWGYTGSWGK